MNTGNGHRAVATVLKNEMEELYPGIHIEMINATGKATPVSQFIAEKGYKISCNYIGAFPLVYDLQELSFVRKIIIQMVNFSVAKYMKHYIYKNKITDIVCFHFLLAPALKRIVRDAPWKININSYISDPFNGPYLWFYDRSQKYMVPTDEMKRMGTDECHIRPENIKVVPFLMQKKFRRPSTPEEISMLKKRFGFAENKRIVLLVGGGEGLPKAVEIVKNCIKNKANFSVAVVCGRDRVQKKRLELLARQNPETDLHIYGFVNFIEELERISDLVVTKAGPSSLYELMSLRKPVIISKYIHNQELGNMRFVVRNGIGFFIRKPKNVFRKIEYLMNNDEALKRIDENYQKLSIETDATEIAEIIYKGSF